MAAQIRTASLTREQADVVDALAAQHGGVSAAMQFLVNFYLANNGFSDDAAPVSIAVHFGGDDGADMPTE